MLTSLPLIVLMLVATHVQPQGAASPPVTYEAFAIQYAVLPNFPVAGLVAGADKTRRVDIPAMFWLLKGSHGRVVLIDAGFYRKKFLDQWKPRDFRTPADAVRAAGFAPEAVTDVVVTHAHWDHVDGVDLFPNATVWIQRDEYLYYLGEAWQRKDTHGGVDEEDVAALLRINTQGRLAFVNGDDQQAVPGVRCYTGGRHTWASQYVTVPLAAGTAVFASDNVYMYENLDKRVPIAQTLDSTSNLKAQDRIRTLATRPELIVPGHDPEVFRRFPGRAPGVVQIQ